MWAGGFRSVELLHTDLDVSDFFLPNGDFRNGSYELHSLATDGRIRGDATPYLTAAGERPPSETVGESVLDILGRSEEHTSELQSLMRISYAVFCLKKKKKP